MHSYYYDRPDGQKGRQDQSGTLPPSDCPPICLTPPRFPSAQEQREARRAWRKERRRRRWKKALAAVLIAALVVGSGTGLGLGALALLQRYAAANREENGVIWMGEEEAQELPTLVERAPLVEGVSLTLSPLPEGEALTYQEIYEKCLPSVVSIQAGSENAVSEGSGIVCTADGYILTNSHVIEGARWVEVVLLDGSETSYEAKLVGRDGQTDLAVLKIEAQGLTPAEFGDSSLVQVGDLALALGNPLGAQFAGTLSDGIISFRDRGVTVEGYEMELIQTTAALNSGNSGGALLNAYGQVIGVTTLKMISDSDTIEGLGFAIPSGTVKTVADALLAEGHISGRPTLGILGRSLSVRECLEAGVTGGVYVSSVEEASDAWDKGLRSGDIIVGVNGQAVSSVEDINDIKSALSAGDVLELELVRDGQRRTIRVELVEQYTLDA